MLKILLMLVMASMFLALPAEAAVVSGESSDPRMDVSTPSPPRPGEGPSPAPNDVEGLRVAYDDSGNLRLALKFWDRHRPHGFYRFHADLGVAGPGASCDVKSQGALRLTLVAEDTPYSPEAMIDVVGAPRVRLPNAGRIDADRAWQWQVASSSLRGRNYNCLTNARYTTFHGATDAVVGLCMTPAGDGRCPQEAPVASATGSRGATVMRLPRLVELSGAAIASETVSVPAGADAYVRSDQAKSNFGTRSSLLVGASPSYASYLKFDLRPYAGRALERASLQVRTAGTEGSSSTGTHNVRFVSNDSWSEGGLTYANRPSVGSSLGSLSPTSASTTYTVALNTVSVAADIGGQLSLAVDSASTNRAEFNSRETTTGARLVLTFSAADGTAPVVTQVSPPNGASDVSPAANVRATFSESIDPSTISPSTVALRDGAGVAVAANLSYDSLARELTVDPTADLTGGTSYTATISGGSSGVKDPAGNPLGTNKVWSFTISAPTSTPPPSAPEGGDLFDMNLQGGDWPAVGSAVTTDDKGPYVGVHHAEHIFVRNDPKGVQLGGATRKVLELRTHDADTGPTSNPRTQLDGPPAIAQGQEIWWGFAYLLPADFPTRVERGSVDESPFHTMASNGGSGSTGGTLRISLGSYAGSWKFGPRFDGNGSWFWYMPRTVDKWIDVVFHVKYAKDATGFLEIYKNEGSGWQIQTLDAYVGGGTRYAGATAKDTEEFPKAPRIANYYLRDQYKHLGFDPVSIYYTEHKIATTFDKAKPHSYE